MIRAATDKDGAEIAGIYNFHIENGAATLYTEPFSAEKLRAVIGETSKKFPFLVCELGGKTAGFCYAHLWKERPAYKDTWEHAIYVSPENGGKGIGGALLKSLIDECRTRNFHALVARITEGNAASAALHKKFGFQRASRFIEVAMKFGRRLNAEDWELIL